jgi:hydroxymethylpyrimidine/phosphomethylpyrimidine kinase
VTPPVLLTIAGSDSGGGAGIQADLKTFAALGAYGASVITAVTAQNTLGVRAIHQVPADVVAAQLDAVTADLPVAAIKVGMIGGVEVAEAIASRAAGRSGGWARLVVDPVLVASSGSRLSAAAAVVALLPYTLVLTPNRAEAGALLGRRVSTLREMADAAGALAAAGPRAVVVTGSEDAVDVLHHEGAVSLLRTDRVATRNDHGSGCTFAAAIAVRLAAGDDVPEAVRQAKSYVTDALDGARDWRLGGGRGPLHHFTPHHFTRRVP